jgi:hypothetical protein
VSREQRLRAREAALRWSHAAEGLWDQATCNRAISGDAERGVFHRAWSKEFGYGHPTREVADFIHKHTSPVPLIEIGAGNGYWAACLNSSGLRVEATDVKPKGTLWPVSAIDGLGAVLHREHWAVLLCHPTYDSDYPREACDAMQPGRMLIHVYADTFKMRNRLAFENYLIGAFEREGTMMFQTLWGRGDRITAWRRA